MKKIKLLVTSLCFILVLAVLFVNSSQVEAAVAIDTNSLEANQIVGGDGVTATYTSSGILAEIPGADTVGASEAWRYGATILADATTAGVGKISDGSVVSMEFSIGVYDSYGNLIAPTTKNTACIDIFVISRTNNAQLAMLRIWLDSGSPNNGDHGCWLYGHDWSMEIKGDEANSIPWIKGDGNLNSSFYIQFDKNELFKSYVGGRTDLARMDNSANKLLNNVNASNAEDIYFKICADGGFANSAQLLVRKINGQELVRTGSGGSNENEVPFVTPGGSSKVSLVNEGIKVKPVLNTFTHFGVFDLKHGLDVKFVVPKASNVVNAYIDLKLVNSSDSSKVLKYRIWLDYSGPDRPTNVFVNDSDYSEAGWISRLVDGLDDKYHMAFDMTDTFLGERKDGMLTQIDVAVSQIKSFLSGCPSSKFYVGFEMGGFSGSNAEFVVTEINEQSLANIGGSYNKVNDAVLHIEDLPDSVVQNNSLTIHTYSKDIFMETVNKVVITAPDGQVSEHETVGTLNYTFTQFGEYKVEISTVGKNGNKVSKEYKIICKNKVQNITFTLPSYQGDSLKNIGDSISIKAATNYSSNVVTKKIVVVMPWTGEEKVVNVGDTLTFDGPGIYTIRYIAQDDALPSPNELVQEINISVMDKTAPVISATLPTEAKTGDTIKFDGITVDDQSDCDIEIVVLHPNGTKSNLKSTDSFIPNKSGTYEITIIVTDMYFNESKITKELVVTGEDIEDSGNEDDPFGDMFDDDDPFGDFEDDFGDDSTDEGGFDIITVLIVIGVVIVIALPGVLVYVIKSRKFK